MWVFVSHIKQKQYTRFCDSARIKQIQLWWISYSMLMYCVTEPRHPFADSDTTICCKSVFCLVRER